MIAETADSQCFYDVRLDHSDSKNLEESIKEIDFTTDLGLSWLGKFLEFLRLNRGMT